MTRGALVGWLGRLAPDELGAVLRRRPDALGAPPPEDLVQLAARLSARTSVEEVVATLPLPAVQVLEALSGPAPVPLPDLADRLGVAVDDPALDATLQVLLQRALVWPSEDDGALYSAAPLPRVPAEPFQPAPPAPALLPADRAAVRDAAVRAATLLLERLPVLLDAAAARPLGRQRSGGVAVREQRRLALASGLDEPTVALLADLAVAARLLGPDGVRLVPTVAYDDWAERAPADRLARLLREWWSGPPLRQVVVRAMHDHLPPDTAVADVSSLAPLVRWTAPLQTRELDDLGAAVIGVVAEATLLGVCASGALSPLGRALADGRSLSDVAQRLLPAAPADTLHVRGVGSVIVSDDTALLDEIVAAAGLAPLKLRRIAPTVAGSALSPVDTLAALRSAGYRPARDAGPGPVRLHRARVDHARRPPARATVDPAELAARLLVPQQRRPSPLDVIRQRAPQLGPEQAQLLADAVEDGSPVWIRYVDANGRTSERVIDNAHLSGGTIDAWCRMRRDDRAFTLDKIVAVAPARV
ncbi:hypothetical protein Daura_46685 [Dactylosporangium aurantiacum]|uniref:WYL domain-containing protein n=1 Tax=Dactylosporangium aurantiacum TaxID=35754 RepID=A0A9Q9IH66_9ACTN|nr:hypothetical protein [Dactylosporangium aurantiacum]MDG6108362.1 hypothetical protein [Dactylosporangium aurantiacum]UWZ53902.1 hypothetical protein Daura_46685 [Dactylosporangium aurantiacum]